MGQECNLALHNRVETHMQVEAIAVGEMSGNGFSKQRHDQLPYLPPMKLQRQNIILSYPFLHLLVRLN